MRVETETREVVIQKFVSDDGKYVQYFEESTRDEARKRVAEYDKSVKCLINQKFYEIPQVKVCADSYPAGFLFPTSCECGDSCAYILECRTKEDLDNIIIWARQKECEIPCVAVFSKRKDAALCNRVRYQEIGSIRKEKVNHGTTEEPDYEELEIDYSLYVGKKVVLLDYCDYNCTITPFKEHRELMEARINEAFGDFLKK